MLLKKPRILAIIPCRAGSKRLKNKNILSINGKPMYEWTLIKLMWSAWIKDIVIATDIDEIQGDASDGFYIFRRPKELCTDISPLDDTLRWVVKEWEKQTNEKLDYVVMCHCNIPIRKEGEIDKLIRVALENPEATAVCSGVEVTEPPEWMFFPYYRGEKHIDLNGKVTKNTCNRYFERTYQAEQVKEFRKQDMPKRYNIDGAIQIHRIDALMKGDGTAYNYFGDKIIIVPHDPIYGIEIDDQKTFNYVEYLMKNENI